MTFAAFAISAFAGLQAQSMLSAALGGSQEVPAAASAATGTRTFLIDTAANTLAFDISISGLQGAEIAAHIHGPVLPGEKAIVLYFDKLKERKR